MKLGQLSTTEYWILKSCPYSDISTDYINTGKNILMVRKQQFRQ